MAESKDVTLTSSSENEQRYRGIIENAFDMIQSCRPDGTFEFVNRAWRQKLGYTPEEVSQLKVWDVIHADSLDHCMELFQRALGGEAVDGVQATFVTKDGRPIPVEGNATSRFIDDKVVATHSFFRDVSERLRNEELERRNLELEQEKRLRSMEKMAALGKLSAGLAHELNNPSAAVQRAASHAAAEWKTLSELTVRLQRGGLAEEHWRRLDQAAQEQQTAERENLSALARADREDEVAAWLEDLSVAQPWDVAGDLVAAGFDRARLESVVRDIPPHLLDDAIGWLSNTLAMAQLLDTIAVSSRHISDLVSAVKQFSYMDRAAEQEIDIHDGLETTLVILQHKLKQGVHIDRDYDRGLPRITVPAGELNQVWANVIDNAIDAAGPEGHVRIATSRDGEAIRVEIADNGPGIPHDMQSRVFDPFFTTKDIGKGTGIGLDTARRIVTELCSGTISFESKPGDTRFYVTLPLHRVGRDPGDGSKV